jgi:hypothetical protein
MTISGQALVNRAINKLPGSKDAGNSLNININILMIK